MDRFISTISEKERNDLRESVDINSSMASEVLLSIQLILMSVWLDYSQAISST